MINNEENYTRLPGRSRGFISLFDPARHQLWLGEDHVLHISKSYFSETYKRFYFNDVQSLTMTRTTTGSIINLFLIVIIILIVFFGLPALPSITSARGVSGTTYFFVTSAGILLIFLVINVLLGPTCRCRLITAVQVENLPSLGRLRSARKTMGILQQAIEAAQGRLGSEDVNAATQQRTVPPISRNAPAGASSLPQAPEKLKHEKGRIHTLLFVLMLVLAASSFIDMVFHHFVKDILDMVIFLAALLSAIVSLIRQQDSDLPAGVKRTAWTALAILVVSFFIGVWAVAIAQMAQAEPRPRDIFSHPPLEGPFFQTFFAIQGLVYGAAGLIGLVQLARLRSTHAVFPAAGVEADRSEKDTTHEG